MARRSTTRQLSDHHEKDAAAFFDGRIPKGSGAQWRDQLDGRQHRLDRLPVGLELLVFVGQVAGAVHEHELASK